MKLTGRNVRTTPSGEPSTGGLLGGCGPGPTRAGTLGRVSLSPVRYPFLRNIPREKRGSEPKRENSRLLAEFELLENLLVTLNGGILQVIKQAAALGDHPEETAA